MLFVCFEFGLYYVEDILNLDRFLPPDVFPPELKPLVAPIMGLLVAVPIVCVYFTFTKGPIPFFASVVAYVVGVFVLSILLATCLIRVAVTLK